MTYRGAAQKKKRITFSPKTLSRAKRNIGKTVGKRENDKLNTKNNNQINTGKWAS